MISIGRIPRQLKPFFQPLRPRFGGPAFAHFWGLVMAITLGGGSTLERLAKRLRGGTHRTKHGEFLWRSSWDSDAVIQAIALDTLRRLYRRRGGSCFFIIDDTQTLKRGKKMEAVGRLYHHASGTYGTGHTILKVCLWYRGVTIPWGSWLYVKREDAPRLRLPFHTLIELAAEAIRTAALPTTWTPTVLFDSAYLAKPTVEACRARGWTFIGTGQSSRNFFVQGRKHKLGRYGKNVLRRGRWVTVPGLRQSNRYRLTERSGWMTNLGEVRVVFSRRRADRAATALVTNDLRSSRQQIVAAYLKRWAVEVLIKEQKQQLGLSDYRLRRYQATVRHLHLVDIAYACLTHLALRGAGAQGRRSANVLRLPPISHLQTRMRQIAWQEALEDVIKHSHEKAVLRRLEKLRAA
ncbi:MAG: transposase [Telluria sp.]